MGARRSMNEAKRTGRVSKIRFQEEGSAGSCMRTLLPVISDAVPRRSALLVAEYLVRFGVDLLLVRGAQFPLMLHLRRPSLRIAGMSSIRHRVLALLRQTEVAFGLRVPLRCCKICHCFRLLWSPAHVRFLTPQQRPTSHVRTQSKSHGSDPNPNRT